MGESCSFSRKDLPWLKNNCTLPKKNSVFSECREDKCPDLWNTGCMENVNPLQIIFPGPTVSMLKQLC